MAKIIAIMMFTLGAALLFNTYHELKEYIEFPTPTRN